MAISISMQEQIVERFDTKPLVKRLLEEKNAVLEKVHQQGFDFGVKSADYLAYQEFHRIEKLSIAHLDLDSEAFADMWELLTTHEYPKEFRLENGEFSNLLPCDYENKVTFVKGWMEGVLSVWNEIKDQFENDDLG